MAALFAVSSIPDTGDHPAGAILLLPPTWQNLLHVPVYAVLCWLWWRARRSLPWAAGITIAFGVLDELYQATVPGRYASVTDALLNAVGALLVVAWVLARGEPSRTS